MLNFVQGISYIGKTEMLNFLQDTVLNVQLPVTLRTVNVVSWCQIKKVLPTISTLLTPWVAVVNQGAGKRPRQCCPKGPKT